MVFYPAVHLQMWICDWAQIYCSSFFKTKKLEFEFIKEIGLQPNTKRLNSLVEVLAQTIGNCKFQPCPSQTQFKLIRALVFLIGP